MDIVLACAALGLAILPWTGLDLATAAMLLVTAALFGLLILRAATHPSRSARRAAAATWPRTSGGSAGRLAGKGVKAYRDRRPPGPAGPPSP